MDLKLNTLKPRMILYGESPAEQRRASIDPMIDDIEKSLKRARED